MKYLLFFLMISALGFSQKFSFKYEAQYQSNTHKPDDINNMNTILDIDGNTSIFREEEDKKNDSLKLNNGMMKMGVENHFYVKKDLSQNKVEKIITYLGSDYLLPIDEKLNWEIASEQKTIGKYKVQKAETNYGGRNWVAWFTTELPFSNGPYIFRGLPGLIISIQDTDNHYSFNLTEVKKGGNLFDTRTKMVKIDWNKYETLAKSYYNDPFDLLSKAGRKITMTDAYGNKVDITERIKEMQKYIQQEDNPLELNHKINYK